jgi:hypothetical protein
MKYLIGQRPIRRPARDSWQSRHPYWKGQPKRAIPAPPPHPHAGISAKRLKLIKAREKRQEVPVKYLRSLEKKLAKAKKRENERGALAKRETRRLRSLLRS